MTASKTAVIVVNWNGEKYLEDLIASVQAEEPSQIVIVDNNSTDASVAILKKHPNILLITNNENLGFGKAANQAISKCQSPYVLILNSDLKALPGSIQSMQEFLNAQNEAGAVAPKLLFEDGSLQPSCRNFPTRVSFFLYLSFLDRIFPVSYRLSVKDHNETRIVEQPMGAALMVRKKVLDQVGNFDESYFLYMEDVDLCERIVKASWKIYFIPESQFIHHAGGSSNQDPLGSQKHFVDSAVLYFVRKNYSESVTRIILGTAFLIRSVIYLFAVKFKKAFNSFKLSMYAISGRK
ncbi:MAG TPA: glycosyltransferase family 2 protein [Acidobacteriota bacterium]|nr:glycosyltransferase family 2 protein [Acidobacteriota bacterium]